MSAPIDRTSLTKTEIETLAADAVSLISRLGDAVLHAVDLGIYCLDPQGRTTFVNEAATRMLGYTMREIVGRPEHELIHHHYADGTEFPVEACPIWSSVSEGIHQRVGGDIFWRKDGTALPVDYTSIPIREGREIVAVVVTFRDITAEQEARAHAERLGAERAMREEAERGREALIESEERFRLALDAGRMGTWEWDIVGERVHWSDQQEQMFGLVPGAFSGTLDEYRMRIHPEDRDEALRVVQERIEKRAPTHHIVHRIVRPDGDVRWIESHARFTYDDRGRPLRLSGLSSDVTRQHLASEQLRQRDERFGALVAASGQIIWTNTPEGRMEGDQPGWSGFTGQSRAEYEGFGWANAVHPDDAQPTIDAWNEAVARRGTFIFRHRVRRHDGIWRWFDIRGVPVLDSDGSIREWVGMHTDVTEQRDLEMARDRALRDAEHARSELLRIFEQAPAAIATLEGPTHIFRTANRLYQELIGPTRQILGLPVRAALPEIDPALYGLLDEVYRTGEPFVGQRVPVQLDRRGDGTLDEGLFTFVYQPIRSAEGAVTGIMVHAIEVE